MKLTDSSCCTRAPAVLLQSCVTNASVTNASHANRHVEQRCAACHHLLLPIHSPVVQVDGKIGVNKVVEHYHIVPAAAQHNTGHAVLKQIVGYNCSAELIVKVHSLHLQTATFNNEIRL